MHDRSAERMSRAAAVMGGRVAGLIGRAPLTQDGPVNAVAQGVAFLSAMREATSGELSAASECDPLDRLAARLSLAPAEIDLIVLAGMTEEHEGYASVLRTLNPRSEPCATAGLAAQLMCEGVPERFALRRVLETGVAVRSGVLALPGDAPLFERNLTLADGLWPVLCGVDVYPASLRPLAPCGVTSGLDEWLDSPAVVRARRALGTDATRAIVVSGETETVALHRALALTKACGLSAAAFERAPTAAPGTDRLALVHALARGAVPIFTLAGSESSSAVVWPALEAFPGPAIVCVRRGTAPEIDGRRPVMILDAGRLPVAARERMWRDLLPELAEHAPTLAARYAIEPAAAREVATDLRARRAINGASIGLDAVVECVHVRCNPPTTAGVRLVRPTARWEQLVLRPDRKALLAEAMNRLIHQGTVLDRWRFLDERPGARGVRVLLSGPPGTGKTLSAEVMARQLGVDLLVVDISRIVSKWIGETEKHLAQAFDAAERMQAVLLFDEADALFGKRTEVSDAHDRYANLETAYLLSRLEQFEGLTILSTNLKQNIDPAFLRRLEFVVEFDEPTAGEREALWRAHLPPQAPLCGDVDLRELAALYPIVGGLIRNASVAAGFLAAAAETAISRDHLIGAIRREYDKSARSFPGAPAGARPA